MTRRTWHQREKTKTNLVNKALTLQDFNINYKKSCTRYLGITPERFNNIFESDLEFKLYVLNRFILNYYHEHCHDMPLQDFIKLILESPKLYFLSTLAQCIDHDIPLVVLTIEDIEHHYATQDSEKYLNCLTRVFSRDFMAVLLQHI